MSDETSGPVAKKMKKGSRKSSEKTRAKELYEPDVSVAAMKDLELERKLSKKLKVKEGRLRGVDDGLSMLLEGMSPFTEFVSEEEVPGSSELPLKKRSKKSSSSKKLKKDKLSKEGMEAESIGGISGAVVASNQDGASEEVPDGIASRTKNKKRKLLDQQQEGDVESRGMDVASEDVPLKFR